MEAIIIEQGQGKNQELKCGRRNCSIESECAEDNSEIGKCSECGIEGKIDQCLHRNEIYNSHYKDTFEIRVLCEDCESSLWLRQCTVCGRTFRDEDSTTLLSRNVREHEDREGVCRRCWETDCLKNGQRKSTIKENNFIWSWYPGERLNKEGWKLYSMHVVPDSIELMVEEVKKMYPTHKVLIKMDAVSVLGNEGQASLYVKPRQTRKKRVKK